MRLFGNGDTYFKPSIPQETMMQARSHKTIFNKNYIPNWTINHFKVNQTVSPKRGTKPRVYKLVEYNDEAVKGSWYPEQIKEISDNQYRIDKVLRKRILANETKNYLSCGNVGQTSTTRGYRKQISTMSWVSDEFQVLLQKM